MPKYFTNDPRLYRGDLLLKQQQYRYTQGSWQLQETYSGRPVDVKYHRTSHLTLYPSATEVSTVEEGPLWQLVITYGSTDPGETILNSTWDLDGNQHELRISNHWKARVLDEAAPGWTRFIETKVDQHYQNTPEKEFTYSTIQSTALTDSSDNPLTVTHANYPLAQLNTWAQDYAEMWERSIEAFLIPRWVIRNTIEVSPNFAFDTSLVLYANINRMLKPYQMQLEPLQSGEVVPAGMIVPGIPWWHKQPFQKSQTNKNTFVINREYWGLESYEPFLYDQAVT